MRGAIVGIAAGTALAAALLASPTAGAEVEDASPTTGPAASSATSPTGGETDGAAQLLERAFHNLYADDYIQTMRLATRSRGGREMARRLQITRKQSIRPGKALLRFLDPYHIRHTSVLILENDGSSDDLYVYLPAVKLTRRLSASQRKDSFFGTDLSYEDVEPKHASDYEARWMGPGDRAGRPCRRVEIRARDHFESTYERMVSCIDPANAVILWTEFYRKGVVIKKLEVDPEQVREIGTKFVAFRMKLENPARRSETWVDTESYEVRPEIPDSLFTTWNLQAGDARRDRSRAGPIASDAPD